MTHQHLTNLSQEQRKEVRTRLRHVQEFINGKSDDATGYRQGFVPSNTTQTQQLGRKVEELAAAGIGVPQATLRNWVFAYKKDGVVALVDKRWLRRSAVLPQVDPRVFEAAASVNQGPRDAEPAAIRSRDARGQDSPEPDQGTVRGENLRPAAPRTAGLPRTRRNGCSIHVRRGSPAKRSKWTHLRSTFESAARTGDFRSRLQHKSVIALRLYIPRSRSGAARIWAEVARERPTYLARLLECSL